MSRLTYQYYPLYHPQRFYAQQTRNFCFKMNPLRVLLSHLCMISRASREIGISGGKMSVSRQFITLRYVSWGLSEQNGGYPKEQNFYLKSTNFLFVRNTWRKTDINGLTDTGTSYKLLVHSVSLTRLFTIWYHIGLSKMFSQWCFCQ